MRRGSASAASVLCRRCPIPARRPICRDTSIARKRPGPLSVGSSKLRIPMRRIGSCDFVFRFFHLIFWVLLAGCGKVGVEVKFYIFRQLLRSIFSRFWATFGEKIFFDQKNFFFALAPWQKKIFFSMKKIFFFKISSKWQKNGFAATLGKKICSPILTHRSGWCGKVLMAKFCERIEKKWKKSPKISSKLFFFR